MGLDMLISSKQPQVQRKLVDGFLAIRKATEDPSRIHCRVGASSRFGKIYKRIGNRAGVFANKTRLSSDHKTAANVQSFFSRLGPFFGPIPYHLSRECNFPVRTFSVTSAYCVVQTIRRGTGKHVVQVGFSSVT